MSLHSQLVSPHRWHKRQRRLHPANAGVNLTDWTQEGFNAQHTGDNRPRRSSPGATWVIWLARQHSRQSYNPQISGSIRTRLWPVASVYLSNFGYGIVGTIDGATGAVKWRVNASLLWGTTEPAFAGAKSGHAG